MGGKSISWLNVSVGVAVFVGVAALAAFSDCLRAYIQVLRGLGGVVKGCAFACWGGGKNGFGKAYGFHVGLLGC